MLIFLSSFEGQTDVTFGRDERDGKRKGEETRGEAEGKGGKKEGRKEGREGRWGRKPVGHLQSI